MARTQIIIAAGSDPVTVNFTAAEETAQDAVDATFEDGATARAVFAEIERIESTMTKRRERERDTGDATAVAWWSAAVAAIDLERAKL